MGIQFDGINNEIKSQTKIDFPGSVGVAGTLTYEDVANVDSIGIITARTGINIGPTAGVAGTFFADGSYVTAGIITAGSFIGDGSALTGIDLGAVTGATGDFSIADKIVHTGDTDTAIRFSGADTVSVETGGVERLEITGTEVVFNDTGTDTDFRIEGDSDANLFKVDASADAIGVGAVPITTGPKFEVTRSTSDAFVNATDCVARLINSDTSANTNQTSLQFTTSTTSTGADSAIVSQAEDSSGNSRLEFWTDTSNGMTEKASIDSTGDLTIKDGDLVIGTSGHGIDFSVTSNAGNSASMSNELFDDYEEGTWVPTSRDGTLAHNYANYTKIGRMVHVTAYLYNFSDNSTNDSVSIQGIPFSQSVGDTAVGSVMYQQVSDANRTVVFINNARSAFLFYGGDTGGYDQVRYNELSGSSTFYMQATYFAS